MFGYFRYLIRLIFCLTILLWAGCLPKGCFGKLGELNQAKPVIKQGTITESIDPSYEGPPYRLSHNPHDPTGSGSKTPKGSKSGGITMVTPPSIPCRELDDIRVNGPEVLIFVDKNAQAQGKGSSWPDAFRSITEATKRAMNIQAIELSNGRPPKDIFIIIASGVYDLAHEKIINSLKDNSSIIDLETLSPNYHQHIAFLGGYKADDTCLENDKNIARRPATNVDREVIIDGSNGINKSNHVVIISGGHHIEFKNITIRDGHAQDSVNPHGKQGGGILLEDSHHIEFYTVTILDAKAEIGGGIAIVGNSHDITIKNSEIKGCRANYGGGAATIGNSHDIIIKDSKIEGCEANYGGGFFLGGTSHDITIDNGKIHNNTFTIYGGGVYIADQANHVFLINKSDLRNNKPKAPANPAKGGGLAIHSDQTITLDDIIISHNQAILGGGGLFINNTVAGARIDVKNSLIDNNELIYANPSAKGGGVYILGPSSNVYLDNTEIKDNILTSGHGGGIALYGSVNHILINNSTIASNKAEVIRPDGLGIYIKDDGVNYPNDITVKGAMISHHYDGRNGGGLYAEGVKNLHLDNLILDHNHVWDDGGGIYIKNSHVVTNKDHRFTDNYAEIKGGALYAEKIKNATLLNLVSIPLVNFNLMHNSAAQGGGLYIEKAPSSIVDGGTYTSNGVKYDPITKVYNKHSREGGAIYYVSDSSTTDNAAELTLRNNANFTDNQVLANGGALYALGVFNLLLDNCVFNDNTADRHGGAIYSHAPAYATARNPLYQQGGDINIINNTTFNRNEADKGGALYIADGLNRLTTQAPMVSFSYNHAHTQGGAIWAHFTNFPSTIMHIRQQTQFTNNGYKVNTDTTTGGAIYSDYPPYLLRIDGDFINNQSIGNGGAIAVDNNTTYMTLDIDKDVLFQNNRSENGFGGALSLNVNVRVRDESAVPPIEGLRGQFVFNKAKNGFGGAVAFLGNILHALPVTAPVTIPFKTCEAIFNRNEAPVDPAIYLARAPIDGLEFANTKFVNSAHHPYQDTDPIVMHTVVGDGGLMKINTPINSLVLKFTKVEGFKSQGNGGAFYLKQVINRIDLYMTAQKNESDRSGGFLYVDQPSHNLYVDINGSYFVSHKAGIDGGVFYLPQIRNVSIVNDKQGTGIAGGPLRRFTVPKIIKNIEDDRYLSGGPPNFKRSENIARNLHNEALRDGGIFFIRHILGNLTINDQVWVDNKAGQSGGAMSIQRIDGDIVINDPLLALNESGTHGGALYINQARNITISSSDVTRFGGRTNHVMQYNNQSIRDRVMATDLFSKLSSVFGNKVNISTLDNYLAGPQQNNYRGQFLLENNKAAHDGGAIYINDAHDITIEKIPFAGNEATNGSGGGLFAANIRGSIVIKESMIYNNKAHHNAAGLYFQGSNATTTLEIEDSSIQKNIMPNKVRCLGSAGLYGHGFNQVTIRRVNFFDNIVQDADTGSQCAAAMKIDDIFPKNAAFTIDASSKLNLLNYDEIIIKGNKILNHDPGDAANIIGTIFIDQAIITDPNYYITLPSQPPANYMNDKPFSAVAPAPGNMDSNEPIPANILNSVIPPIGIFDISHRNIVVSWPGR